MEGGRVNEPQRACPVAGCRVWGLFGTLNHAVDVVADEFCFVGSRRALTETQAVLCQQVALDADKREGRYARRHE